MKRLIFAISVSIFMMLIFAVENRFLFGISSVRAGMTQHEVYQYLGFPEYFETETDNWYILRFYPFVFGAMNVKIDMRDFMSVASDGTPGNGRTGDRVTSIEWKQAFVFDNKSNVQRLTH
jgi:hypothetical protein